MYVGVLYMYYMYTPLQVLWVLSISNQPEGTRQPALERWMRGHKQLGIEQGLGLWDGRGVEGKKCAGKTLVGLN